MQFTWRNHRFQRIMLKKFLKHHGISHRLFQAVKHHGGLRVNCRPVRCSVPLQLGDQVTVVLPPEGSDPHLRISYSPLHVIYEDPNWLVINKPAGLTSVPGPSNRSDTLVNRLKGYLQRSGSANLRPHLVTRLDRFTSGVVLVAKHRMASNLANQLLAQHQLHKEYVALVSGKLGRSHGQIRMPIGKRPDEIKRHFMRNGQPAWTEYWRLRQTPRFAVVRVKLHTGRTHQIRVHFTELGHPLLGDHLYGGPLNLGIRRQALHAKRLWFTDPFSGHRLRFTAPLPNDIRLVLRNSGGHHYGA